MKFCAHSPSEIRALSFQNHKPPRKWHRFRLQTDVDGGFGAWTRLSPANHFRTRRTSTKNSLSIFLNGLARSIEKKLWLSNPITQRRLYRFLLREIRRRSDVCVFDRLELAVNLRPRLNHVWSWDRAAPVACAPGCDGSARGAMADAHCRPTHADCATHAKLRHGAARSR
jgi:hypothetical protein